MSNEFYASVEDVGQEERVEYALRCLIGWLYPQQFDKAAIQQLYDILDGKQDKDVLDWWGKEL